MPAPADGELTVVSYDGAGRLVGTRSAEVDHTVERDAAGRVVAESWNGRRLDRTLDLLGRPVSRRTPAGVTSSWQYDVRGAPIASRTASPTTGGGCSR